MPAAKGNTYGAKPPEKRRDDQITVRLPTGFRSRMLAVTGAKGIAASSWVADLIGSALARSEKAAARKLKPFPVAPLPSGWRLKKPAEVTKALEQAADTARARVSRYTEQQRKDLRIALQTAQEGAE